MKKITLILISFALVSRLTAQNPVPHSNEVLQEAYRQAANENKNVFLMFHASWCGWCHKMDSTMNEAGLRELFTNNYVITHLTVYESKDKKTLENPGGMDFLAKYRGTDLGIPYWMILDKSGKWLADSQIRAEGSDYTVRGENVGCPASTEEVNHFLKVLLQTSKLDATQLSAIEKRFLLKK